MEGDNRMDDKLEQMQSGPAPENAPPEGTPAPEGEQSPAKAQRDGSASRDLYLNVRVLVGMMAAFVLLFTFVVRVIVVSGPSMESTLWERDLILVWSLGYEPKQGDIVVLTQESYQEDSIVKRVIATGGQTVDIDFASGVVYVDGQPLDEPYVKGFTDTIEGTRFPLTLAEDEVFVMGDHRDHSTDSRSARLGPVKEGYLQGKAVLLLLPGTNPDLGAREWDRIGLVR